MAGNLSVSAAHLHVKFFYGTDNKSKLEEEVNAWLSAQSEIWIHSIDVRSSATGCCHHVTCVVIYSQKS